MTRALALLALLVPPAALAQESAPTKLGADGHLRRPAQDVRRYDVTVDLTGEEPAVITKIEIAAVAPLPSIELDYCGPALDRVRRSEAKGEEEPVEGFAWKDGLVRVPLRKTLAPGRSATLVLESHGWPKRGLFHRKNRHGELVVFTDAWPSDTRFWMPCEDHPSDKAKFAAVLELPRGWSGVSNGRCVEESVGERGVVERWECDAPLYTAVMCFAAGRFEVVRAMWGDVPLQWWLYPQDVEAGTKDFAIHARALDFLQKTIGPYPYAKYAVVQIPTQYGGMENASNTFLREGAVDGTGHNASVLIHEASHQWFGDSVTEEDWHDLFLSEGFATYFCAVTMDALGLEPLASGMARLRDEIVGDESVLKRPVVDTGLVDPKTRLDANAYQKGAWALHMMRAEIGDDAFFAGIRAYYAAHRDRNATHDDLRRALEESSGKDLSALFRQWLERPGYPKVELVARREGDDLLLSWSQQNAAPQDPAPFAFGLDVAGCANEKGPPLAQCRARVAIDAPRGEARLAGFGKVAALALDPEVKLLAALDLREIARAGR